MKTLTGEILTVYSETGDTIDILKQKISEVAAGVHPDNIRLIFEGKCVISGIGKTVADYGIGTGCTLHMVLRLRMSPELPQQEPDAA